MPNCIKIGKTDDNLTAFNMAAVRHLVFMKFIFFIFGDVKRYILHQRTKFREDRSSRCGEISIFVIFQMAAATILDI